MALEPEGGGAAWLAWRGVERSLAAAVSGLTDLRREQHPT